MIFKSLTTYDPLSVLESRTASIPSYSYKLNGGNYGMDVTISDTLDMDESAMSIWIPFADGRRRDGVGDLLEVGGIVTDRHKSNPVCLFDHGKAVTLPIARAEDPATGVYTVVIDEANHQAKVNAFFYQQQNEHGLFCEQVYDLLVKRFIRAGSIGYQVIKAVALAPDYQSGTPQGLHLQQVRMLEVSVVVMPANQDTVRKGLDTAREILCLGKVCGQPLSPLLVKSLTPYVGPRKAQMGYEGKAVLGLTKPGTTSKRPQQVPYAEFRHDTARGTVNPDDPNDVSGRYISEDEVGDTTPDEGVDRMYIPPNAQIANRGSISYDIRMAGRPPNYRDARNAITVPRPGANNAIGTSGEWSARRPHSQNQQGTPPDKGMIPVPLSDVHGGSKIPPARWKPGVGAIKALRLKYRVKAVPATPKMTSKEQDNDGYPQVEQVEIVTHGDYEPITLPDDSDKGNKAYLAPKMTGKQKLDWEVRYPPIPNYVEQNPATGTAPMSSQPPPKVAGQKAQPKDNRKQDIPPTPIEPMEYDERFDEDTPEFKRDRGEVGQRRNQDRDQEFAAGGYAGAWGGTGTQDNRRPALGVERRINKTQKAIVLQEPLPDYQEPNRSDEIKSLRLKYRKGIGPNRRWYQDKLPLSESSHPRAPRGPDPNAPHGHIPTNQRSNSDTDLIDPNEEAPESQGDRSQKVPGLGRRLPNRLGRNTPGPSYGQKANYGIEEFSQEDEDNRQVRPRTYAGLIPRYNGGVRQEDARTGGYRGRGIDHDNANNFTAQGGIVKPGTETSRPQGQEGMTAPPSYISQDHTKPERKGVGVNRPPELRYQAGGQAWESEPENKLTRGDLAEAEIDSAEEYEPFRADTEQFKKKGLKELRAKYRAGDCGCECKRVPVKAHSRRVPSALGRVEQKDNEPKEPKGNTVRPLDYPRYVSQNGVEDFGRSPHDEFQDLDHMGRQGSSHDRPYSMYLSDIVASHGRHRETGKNPKGTEKSVDVIADMQAKQIAELAERVKAILGKV